jgi:hypothetical protein
MTKRPRQRHAAGFPVATMAAYGPDNKRATKLVVSILQRPGDREPRAMWGRPSSRQSKPCRAARWSRRHGTAILRSTMSQSRLLGGIAARGIQTVTMTYRKTPTTETVLAATMSRSTNRTARPQRLAAMRPVLAAAARNIRSAAAGNGRADPQHSLTAVLMAGSLLLHDYGGHFEPAAVERIHEGIDDERVEVGARSFTDDVSRFEE